MSENKRMKKKKKMKLVQPGEMGQKYWAIEVILFSTSAVHCIAAQCNYTVHQM